MGFIEEMKWWHWICVSLVLGAALAYINKTNVSQPASAQQMAPQLFEEYLMRPPLAPGGAPWVRNIWVYPPMPGPGGAQVQMITFQWADPAQDSPTKKRLYKPYVTMATLPFVPAGSSNIPQRSDAFWPGTTIHIGKEGDTVSSLAKQYYGSVTAQTRQYITFSNRYLRSATSAARQIIVPGEAYFIPWSPASNHTFRDFLDAAKPKANWVTYHYAFWHAANLVYPLWMGASFVVVGLLWPAVATILIRGGLGRVREKDEYDLSRFKGGSDARPAALSNAVTEADMRQLAALEASLEASLAASPTPDRAQEEKAPEAPVRVLDATPTASKDEPKEPVKLKDEEFVYDAFYPVARGGKKS